MSRGGAQGGPAERLVAAATLAALAALLLFPLHVPHQHPDQDLPPLLALVEFLRGTWRPAVLVYPSGLTNLLRLGYETAYAIGSAAGWLAGREDLVAAWCAAPWAFRMPPRAVAILAGVVTLLAARRLAALADGREAGLTAAVLLGTSLVFVREHHHGMLDAPASAAAMCALVAAGRYVRCPAVGTIAWAGALAGAAVGFKYNLAPIAAGVVVAAMAGPAPGRVRVGRAVTGAAAALGTFALLSPYAVLYPAQLHAELTRFASLQSGALGLAVGPGGNRMIEAFRVGLGGSVVVAAAIGAAVVHRRPVLWPLLGFVAGYLVLLLRSPLVLNRYALPLAAPLTVLAAHAIASLPWRSLRLGVTTLLVMLALPAVAAYLRVLGTEDTRVTAARWLEQSVPAGTRVFGGCGLYALPDLPAPGRWLGQLEVDVAGVRDALACPARLALPPIPVLVAEPRQFRRMHQGSVIVTCETPGRPMPGSDSAPALRALLASQGRLLAEFPAGHADAGGVYEPFDLHWIPVEGAASLDRPGPHIRIWSVDALPAERPGRR